MHPDKVAAAGSSEAQRERTEAAFRCVQEAYEASLTDDGMCAFR